VNQTPSAVVICSKLLNQRYEVYSVAHKITMPRKKKHPTEMTTEELAKDLFHPKVLSAAKKHIRELSDEKPKRTKKSSR
jgi:hypothetical protein